MKESVGHTAELEKLTADIHQLVEYIAALDDKEKTKAIKDDTEKLETEYKHGMEFHRKRIEQIMFQDVRAFAKVYSRR